MGAWPWTDFTIISLMQLLYLHCMHVEEKFKRRNTGRHFSLLETVFIDNNCTVNPCCKKKKCPHSDNIKPFSIKSIPTSPGTTTSLVRLIPGI